MNMVAEERHVDAPVMAPSASSRADKQTRTLAAMPKEFSSSRPGGEESGTERGAGPEVAQQRGEVPPRAGPD